MIRVLVWAKAAIVRAGLESIVQADERFSIVRSDGDGGERLAGSRFSTPDVILVDSSNSGMQRIHSEIGPDCDGTALVILIENATRGDLLRLLNDGPKTLLSRDSRPSEITAALQAASEGLVVLSPELFDSLWPSGSEIAAIGELPPGEPLTARESEVLALLADGAGNKEIGARLRISEHTAKFHVSSILTKLGATTRTEAVTRGYREGLIVI